MKRTRTPTRLAKNASKLHTRVGELLTHEDSPFKNYEIRQEYAVSLVNPNYKSNREKFDWVVLGLKIVIEVHGEQHFTPTCFGGISEAEAEAIYRDRVRVDAEKEAAAREAGWAYVVVKYTEKKITLEELVDRITDALREVVVIKVFSKAIKRYNEEVEDIIDETEEKPKRKYNWPTGKKIPSRKFNGEIVRK